MGLLIKYSKGILVILMVVTSFLSCLNSNDTNEQGLIGFWIFTLTSAVDNRQQTLEFTGEENKGSVLIEGQEAGTFTVTEEPDGTLKIIIKLDKENLYSYKLWGTFLPSDLTAGSLTGYYHILINDVISSANYKWDAKRKP